MEAQRQAGQSQLARLKSLRSNGRIALEIDPAQQNLAALPAVPLEDGDRIVIPSVPGFVAAFGSVSNENVLVFRQGRTVGDVVRLAGLTEDADGSNLMLYSQILKVAQARGASFVPVRLLCDLEEHLSRVVRPERRKRMKGVDPDEARDKHANHKLFVPDHANTLTLNVTGLTPEIAAQTILEHALNIR